MSDIIKCACGSNNCRVGIHFDTSEGYIMLVWHGKFGEEETMLFGSHTLMALSEDIDNILCNIVIANDPDGMDEQQDAVPERLRDEV